MLFAPTSVLPDVRAGVGAGTVDVSDGLTVSWHISGTSAMSAFSISICENDAESTPRYSTGKLTAGCPAYGTSREGTPLFFSHNIAAADWDASGIENGGEYKLSITQYWMERGVEKRVTQNSASVFIARSAPIFYIVSVPTYQRSFTFQGLYSQAEGDALEWFRWQIAGADDPEAPLLDSGPVYGSGDISAFFDGFLPNTSYCVRLTAQTASGVMLDSGWRYFQVSYAVDAMHGLLTASCVSGGAVKLSIRANRALILPEPGEYSVEDSVAVVPKSEEPEGVRVVWDEADGDPLNFRAPWTILWRGSYGTWTDPDIMGATVIFRADFNESGSDYVEAGYSSGFMVSSLEWRCGGAASSTIFEGAPGWDWTIALTPNKMYLSVYEQSDITSDRAWKIVDEFPVSLPQSAIRRFALGGPQTCQRFAIIPGEPSSEDLKRALTTDEEWPSWDASYLRSDFAVSGGVRCESLPGVTQDKLSVYRRSGNGVFLQKIADIPAVSGDYYDYGAVSGGGPYEYLAFLPEARDKCYLSRPVSPLWWDWTLLECDPTAEKNVFFVRRSYIFRLNVETGAMSNNASPTLQANFTRYPAVQLSTQRYKSSTLSGLIGAISQQKRKRVYLDSIALRDAIFALSTTERVLFLKNRKGDLIRVRISGPITMQTDDASVEQAQTASIPWVEVGPADGVSLYSSIRPGR